MDNIDTSNEKINLDIQANDNASKTIDAFAKTIETAAAKIDKMGKSLASLSANDKKITKTYEEFLIFQVTIHKLSESFKILKQAMKGSFYSAEDMGLDPKKISAMTEELNNLQRFFNRDKQTKHRGRSPQSFEKFSGKINHLATSLLDDVSGYISEDRLKKMPLKDFRKNFGSFYKPFDERINYIQEIIDFLKNFNISEETLKSGRGGTAAQTKMLQQIMKSRAAISGTDGTQNLTDFKDLLLDKHVNQVATSDERRLDYKTDYMNIRSIFGEYLDSLRKENTSFSKGGTYNQIAEKIEAKFKAIEESALKNLTNFADDFVKKAESVFKYKQSSKNDAQNMLNNDHSTVDPLSSSDKKGIEQLDKDTDNLDATIRRLVISLHELYKDINEIESRRFTKNGKEVPLTRTQALQLESLKYRAIRTETKIAELKEKIQNGPNYSKYGNTMGGSLLFAIRSAELNSRQSGGLSGILARYGTSRARNRYTEDVVNKKGKVIHKKGDLKGFIANVYGNLGGTGLAIGGLALGMFGKAIESATDSLKKFSAETMEAFGSIQSIRTNLGVVFGNQTEADSIFGDLAKYALKSPFGVQETSEQAVLLRQSGIYSSDLLDTMKRIGDVAGGNVIKMQRIASNYAKIVSMGNATMVNMRQFAYAGLPIYSEVAKQLKVSQGTLRAMIKDGKVTSEVIEDVFRNMTNEGGIFFNAVDKGSKTYTARKMNLQDAKTLSYASAGQWIYNVGAKTNSGQGHISNFLNLKEHVYNGLQSWFDASNLRKTILMGKEGDKSEAALKLETLEGTLQRMKDYGLTGTFEYKEIEKSIKELKETLTDYESVIAARAEFTERYEREKGFDKKVLSPETKAALGVGIGGLGVGLGSLGAGVALTGLGGALGSSFFGVAISLLGSIATGVAPIAAAIGVLTAAIIGTKAFLERGKQAQLYEESKWSKDQVAATKLAARSDDTVQKLLDKKVDADTGLGSSFSMISEASEAAKKGEIRSLQRSDLQYANRVKRFNELLDLDKQFKKTDINGDTFYSFDKVKMSITELANSMELLAQSSEKLDLTITELYSADSNGNGGALKDKGREVLETLRDNFDRAVDINFDAIDSTGELAQKWNTVKAYLDNYEVSLNSSEKYKGFLGSLTALTNFIDKIGNKDLSRTFSFMTSKVDFSTSGKESLIERTKAPLWAKILASNSGMRSERIAMEGSRYSMGIYQQRLERNFYANMSKSLMEQGITLKTIQKETAMYYKNGSRLDWTKSAIAMESFVKKQISEGFSEGGNTGKSIALENALITQYQDIVNKMNELEQSSIITEDDADMVHSLAESLGNAFSWATDAAGNFTENVIRAAEEIKRVYANRLLEQKLNLIGNKILKSQQDKIKQTTFEANMTGRALIIDGKTYTMPEELQKQLISSYLEVIDTLESSGNQLTAKKYNEANSEIGKEARLPETETIIVKPEVKPYTVTKSYGNETAYKKSEAEYNRLSNINFSNAQFVANAFSSEFLKAIKDGELSEKKNLKSLFGDAGEYINSGKFALIKNEFDSLYGAGGRVGKQLSKPAAEAYIKAAMDIINEKNKGKALIDQYNFPSGSLGYVTNSNSEKEKVDADKLINLYSISNGKHAGLSPADLVYVITQSLQAYQQAAANDVLIDNVTDPKSASKIIKGRNADIKKIEDRAAIYLLENIKIDESFFDTDKLEEDKAKAKSNMEKNKYGTTSFTVKGSEAETKEQELYTSQEQTNEILKEIKTLLSNGNFDDFQKAINALSKLEGVDSVTVLKIVKDFEEATKKLERAQITDASWKSFLRTFGERPINGEGFKRTQDKSDDKWVQNFNPFIAATKNVLGVGGRNNYRDSLRMAALGLNPEDTIENAAETTFDQKKDSKEYIDFSTIVLNKLIKNGSLNAEEAELVGIGDKEWFKDAKSRELTFSIRGGERTPSRGRKNEESSPMDDDEYKEFWSKKYSKWQDIRRQQFEEDVVKLSGARNEDGTEKAFNELTPEELQKGLELKLKLDITEAEGDLKILETTFEDIGKGAKDALSQTLINGWTGGIKESVKNLRKMEKGLEDSEDAGNSLKNFFASLAEGLTDTMAQLTAAAGMKLILAGQYAAGAALIAASGIFSTLSGVLAADQDNKDKTKDETSRLKALKDSLADLLKQAKADAEYYSKNLTHSKALSANTSLETTKVNDMILTPNGTFSTHPDDYLIATKTPGALIGSGRNGTNVNVNVINQGGELLTVKSTTQNTDDDGNVNVDMIVEGVMAKKIADGSMNSAFAQLQYGAAGNSVVG